MKPTIEPHPKQHEAWQYLKDDNTRYVLFGGGARGGKSWLGWEWLITQCFFYPGTKWFVGREELKRLRQTTLQTFWKVLDHHDIPASQVNYNAQDYFIEINGCKIDLLELKERPRDPEFERFGSSEYTGGWIEEAGEVVFKAYDVLKSRIGQHYNDKYGITAKMYITCNPARNWLYRHFYKPWKAGELSDEKAFVPALVQDNWYREEGAEQQLKDLESESLRERLLHGNWEYEDDPEQLIKYKWVEEAASVEYRSGKRRLGVDVARFGDDDTVIAHLQGNTLRQLDSTHGIDTVKTANTVEELMNDKSISAHLVGVDVVGLGAGVVDTLISNGKNVTEIVSGASPIEEVDSSYSFKNLRSQMWWQMREDLKNGRNRIEVKSERLIEDLTAPRYKISSDKVVEVESKDKIKKRIGRSTDYADAYVYGNFVEKIGDRSFMSIA